jgi:RNA polymerase sigma-70 factor (ECF subfamily)
MAQIAHMGLGSLGIEADLARLHAAGDRAGTATLLVEAYGAELLGFLVHALGDLDEAEEVFATASLQLWRGLDGFRGDSAFRTWAYRVVRNALAHDLRRADRRRRGRWSEAPTTALRYRERTATRPELRTDRKCAIRELRDALSPDDRALLALRVDKALAWTEVARIWARDGDDVRRVEAALRKRFQRVVERLRALAMERGLLDQDAPPPSGMIGVVGRPP